MKLSPENTDLFYRLMWQLRFFVNERLGILPKVNSVEKYSRLASVDKLEVRAALWEHPDLIDAFVVANPGGLSGDQLSIVESWKHFVAQVALSDPQDLTALWEHEAKTRRALIRLERTLNREE